MLKNILKKLVELYKSITTIQLLTLILIGALFVRVYRVGDLLGFYYDQGRDALVIWRLWHEGKPFLIGPVTGLQGIYLGPFYYYLIAPLYLIGRGNPVWPTVFLAFLSTCSVLMLYILGRSMHSRTAGIIAATVGAFSYFIILHSRWLSNPNPILLISLLLLYSMWKIVGGKDNQKLHDKPNGIWWVAVGLFLGIALQLEAASAIFYIPAILIFALWQKKFLPGKKVMLTAIIIFFATLFPQIVFNFRHENILFNNFFALFFKEKAFRGIAKTVLLTRLRYFWSVFASKLYAAKYLQSSIFISLSLSALLVRSKKLKKGILRLFAIFFIVPMVGYLFFQGNFGNIYDYYMSGYYLPFILIFSIGLAEFARTLIGKISVIIFLITFLSLNLGSTRKYLDSQNTARPVILEDQLKSIDWIYQKAEQYGEFNVDVYVPPVIPHAYDYLFLWKGTRECGENLCGKVDRQVSTLFTLFEEDRSHPERLKVWLEKQHETGEVEDQVQFGMITVQRRRRSN